MLVINKEIQKDTLIKHYFVEKMSQKAVAEKYNVSISVVYRLQKKYNIEPLEIWEKRYPQHISSVQKEVLYGSLLGDDCVYKFKTANYACLIVYHSTSQKEYIQLKFDIWQHFIRKNQLTKRKRKKGTRYCFVTGVHPEFNDIRNIYYRKNIKIISMDILNKLTPISLAFWFCDDGSRCKNRGLALHTNCFKLEEVEMVCEWFKNKYAILCNPQRRKENQYVVFFSNKTSDKFADIILPWILPSMRYKLKGIFTKNPQRLYANPFRYNYLISRMEDIV